MNKVTAPVVIHHQVQHLATGLWHLSPDVWTAIGSCVGASAAVVALIIAVIFGLRTVGEARRLRREQAQPYVAVFIEETGTGIHQYNLAVKNFGATAAKSVQVTITPKPRSANLRNSNAEDWLKVPEVIPVLVPGQRWDTYWDWSGALDEAKDLPRAYVAEVSFNDSRGKYVDTYRFPLDWGPLIDRGSQTKYGVHQVADALQDIRTTINRVTSGQGQVTVESFDRDSERKQNAKNRRKRLRRWRVAGNTQDDPSRLDHLLVRAEKLSERLKRRWDHSDS
jgi:hypothetical protein